MDGSMNSVIYVVVGMIVLAILTRLIEKVYILNRTLMYISLGLSISFFIVLFGPLASTPKSYLGCLGIVGVFQIIAVICCQTYGVNSAEYDWKHWTGDYEIRETRTGVSVKPAVFTKGFTIFIYSTIIVMLIDVVLARKVSIYLALVPTIYCFARDMFLYMNDGSANISQKKLITKIIIIVAVIVISLAAGFASNHYLKSRGAYYDENDILQYSQGAKESANSNVPSSSVIPDSSPSSSGETSPREEKQTPQNEAGQSVIGYVRVKVNELRMRNKPGTDGYAYGFADKGGIYPVYETAINGGYTWYRIDNDVWIADDNGKFLDYSKDGFSGSAGTQKESIDPRQLIGMIAYDVFAYYGNDYEVIDTGFYENEDHIYVISYPSDVCIADFRYSIIGTGRSFYPQQDDIILSLFCREPGFVFLNGVKIGDSLENYENMLRSNGVSSIDYQEHLSIDGTILYYTNDVIVNDLPLDRYLIYRVYTEKDKKTVLCVEINYA